jgi:hypothetical protein
MTTIQMSSSHGTTSNFTSLCFRIFVNTLSYKINVLNALKVSCLLKLNTSSTAILEMEPVARNIN